MCSISKLSSEQLLRIFMHNSQQDCQFPFDPVVTMMACSHVCRRWRRIIFRNALLWNASIDLSKSSHILNHVVHLSGDNKIGPLVLPSITPLILKSATVRSAIRGKKELPILEVLLSNPVYEPNLAKRFMALFSLMSRTDSLILKMPHHGWIMLDLLFSNPVSHLETLVLARSKIDFDADRETSTVAVLNEALKRAEEPWSLRKLFLQGCSIDLRSKALVELQELTLQHLPHGVAWSIPNLLAILKTTPKLVKLDLRHCTQTVHRVNPRSELHNANTGQNSNNNGAVVISLTQPWQAEPVRQEGGDGDHFEMVSSNLAYGGGTASLISVEPVAPSRRNSRKVKEKFVEPPAPKKSRQNQTTPLLPAPPPPPPVQILVPPLPTQYTSLPHLTSLVLQGPVGHVCDLFRSLKTPVGCNISLHSSSITSLQVHNHEHPLNMIFQAMSWRFQDRSKMLVAYGNLRPWTSMVVSVHAGCVQMRVFDSNTDRGAAIVLAPTSSTIRLPIRPSTLSPSLFEVTFEWNEALSRPFADAPQKELRIDPFNFFRKLTEHIGEASRDVEFLHFEYAFFPPFSDYQNVTHTEALLTFLNHFQKARWMDRITTPTFEFLLPYFMHPFKNHRAVSSNSADSRSSVASTNSTSRTPTPGDKDGMVVLPDPLKSLTSMRFYKVDFSKTPWAYSSLKYTLGEVLLHFVLKRLNQDGLPEIVNIILEECTGMRPEYLDKLDSMGVTVGRYNSPGGQKF